MTTMALKFTEMFRIEKTVLQWKHVRINSLVANNVDTPFLSKQTAPVR